jgi:hypothetical protein
MATLDRIDAGFTPWTPSVTGIGIADDDYVGRHRKDRGRTLSVRRMFYAAQHRRH